MLNARRNLYAERPIRVVHLITELDVGGAETMLARLVGSAECRSVKNTVVSLASGGAAASTIAQSGVRQVDLNMRPGRPSALGLVRLVRLLRAIRPHVLQTWLYHADLVGLVAGTIARVPALAWNVRCSQLNFADYSRMLPLVVRVLSAASRWPDAVVCNSAAGQRTHEALGYRPRRWVLIPNGVDIDVFRPCPVARIDLRRELGIESAAPLVGLVARLHPMKDHATFIRAAALVREQAPGVHFVAVGRGVGRSPMLNTLIADLNLGGRVHLQDERHDTARVLAGLDVAVSSSDSGEGCPNVVIEAMACGVPCTVTDVGDAAGIVAHTGLTVPSRQPEALARSVVSLLSLPAAQREALGRAARERVAGQFSLSHVTAQYERLYQELAAPYRDAAPDN